MRPRKVLVLFFFGQRQIMVTDGSGVGRGWGTVEAHTYMT